MVKFLTIIVVIVTTFAAFLLGNQKNSDKIHRAEIELQKMKSMRDSLVKEVTVRDQIQEELKSEITIKDRIADDLREQVQKLEETRKELQLSVRKIHKKDDLQARLTMTFPEMAASDWGVIEIHNENADIDIEYLLIPLWFSETFIIDHQNAQSWKQQKDKLLSIDSLNKIIFSLKDSMYILEHENRLSYEKGFDEAFKKFETVNKEYINELKKGKYRFLLGIAGMTGGGIIGYTLPHGK